MHLFDTNVISELYKFRNHKIDPNLCLWLSGIQPSLSFISCVTLSEIQMSILLKQRKDLAKAARLMEGFKGQIIPTYQIRTLAITAEIALQAA